MCVRYRLSRFHPYDYILEYFLFYQFSRCASRKQYRFRPYTSYAKQLDVSGLGAGDGHGKPYQQGRSLRRGAMLGCPSVNPLANLQLGRMLSISIEILPLFSDLLISEVISGKALTVFTYSRVLHTSGNCLEAKPMPSWVPRTKLIGQICVCAKAGCQFYSFCRCRILQHVKDAQDTFTFATWKFKN